MTVWVELMNGWTDEWNPKLMSDGCLKERATDGWRVNVWTIDDLVDECISHGTGGGWMHERVGDRMDSLASR